MSDIRSAVIAIIVTTAASLTACGTGSMSTRETFTVPVRIARMQAPELPAEPLRVDVGVRWSGDGIAAVENTVVVLDQIESRKGGIDDLDNETGLDAALSLAPRIQAYYEAGSVEDGLGMLGIKWQILGAPRERSTIGSTSLMWTVAAGQFDGSATASLSNQAGGVGMFAAPGDVVQSRWSYRYDGVAIDTSLVVGRRVHDRLLVYGGPFYIRYDLTTELESETSVLAADPDLGRSDSSAEFSYDDTLHTFGFSAAFDGQWQSVPALTTTVGLSSAWTKWNGGNVGGGRVALVNLGLRWHF